MVKVGCAVCGKHEAEKGVKLFTCSQCKSVPYCSKECQRFDWKTGHKKICNSLSAGDAQQVVHLHHQRTSQETERWRDEILNGNANSDCPDFRPIWDLFLKSKDATNHDATVKKMKKLFRRQTRLEQQVFLSQSLVVMRDVPTEMLELPTSPLKIALQFVDPSLLCKPPWDDDCDMSMTPLHFITFWADPDNEVANSNQCIAGKQLLAAGAKVNALSEIGYKHCTPLHLACHSNRASNLDFIRLLIDHGADPNALNVLGETALHYTMALSPGAAKFLLEYCEKTDPNIVVSSPAAEACGESFLAMVRAKIEGTRQTCKVLGENELNFLRGQLVELEEILVERGALDIRPSHG